MIESGQEKF